MIPVFLRPHGFNKVTANVPFPGPRTLHRREPTRESKLTFPDRSKLYMQPLPWNGHPPR
jgi:hypothetical protein